MSYTTNNNLPLLPAGAVDWLAAYNDAMAKIEAGATLYLQAGEALAVRDCFYIKSDGKAWKATTATACDGIWQSTSTAAGAWGFGQIGGTMTYASWAWTPGSLLYSNGSGALTTTETPYLVAIAKSATEISLIKPHTHKVITASNTGLKVLDTNASQYLIIKPGSDLSADRTLTLTTGDADRTITLSGNPTLADWFDQSVKTTDSPTYATVKCTGLTDTALPKHTSDATGLQDSVIKEDASGNLLFNGATAGTALAKGQAYASGTAPTTSPADEAQTYVTDTQGAAGYARLHERTEDGKASSLALRSEVSDSLGALSPVQGLKSLASSTVAPLIVADNDNIDMETNDFTLHFEGSLPDWTPSTAVYLEHKLVSSVGYTLGVTATSGYLFVTINADTYTLSVATNFVDGSTHKISAVITRGTTQTLQFYVDKLPFGTAQTITTNASNTVNNSNPLYILGSAATTRYEGTVHSALLYNRALTATQVYNLHNKGVDFSDMYGSQTVRYTSDFSANTDGWVGVNGTTTGNIDGISGYNDCLRFYANATNSYHLIYHSVPIPYNKRWRVSFEYYIPSTNTNVKGLRIPRASLNYSVISTDDYIYTTQDAWTAITFEQYDNRQLSTYGIVIRLCDASNSIAFAGANSVTDDLVYFKNITFTQIGVVWGIVPETIQSTKAYDITPNANDLIYPESGTSLLRPNVPSIDAVNAEPMKIIEGLFNIFTPSNSRLLMFADAVGEATTITDRCNLGGGTANTITLRDASLNAQAAYKFSPSTAGLLRTLNLDTINLWDCPDSDLLSFGDGSSDSAFSLIVLFRYDYYSINYFIAKVDGTSGATRKEYYLGLASNGHFVIVEYDNSAGSHIGRISNTYPIDRQWHCLIGTKSTGITSAANKLYLDGTQIDIGDVASGSYTAMENTTMTVGSYILSSGVINPCRNPIAFIGIVAEELTATQVLRIDRLLRSAVGVKI